MSSSSSSSEPGADLTPEQIAEQLAANASNTEAVPAELLAKYHPFQAPPKDIAVSTTEDAESAAVDMEMDRKGLLKRLKDFVGADLTRIAIPVFFNEPTSFLHRMAEATECAPELYNKAAAEDNAALRLVYVTIASIAPYSCGERTSKPFNPLLGETFEWVTPTSRGVCEQVSHHPPICAANLQAKDWEWQQYKELTAKFTGNAVTSPPIGTTKVFFPKRNETYTWGGLTSCVHNLIVGKLWIDHYGDVTLTSNASKANAAISFFQCGWFSRNWHHVEAIVSDENGTPKYFVCGEWNSQLLYWDIKLGKDPAKVPESEKKVGWKMNQVKSPTLWRGFHKFLDDLRELTPIRMKTLPRSDARFRPDILELERYNYSRAGQEKWKLEEKQRAERKLREEGHLGDWKQRYFELDGDGFWKFRRNYWQEREERFKAENLSLDCPPLSEFQ